MQIPIGDWIFEVDIENTMAYSVNVLEDHCQCGYCRNFYQAIDIAYPALRPFLAQFGMNVETPEELMPFEPTVCAVSYCISGRILRRGLIPPEGGGTVFSVETMEEKPYETNCACPYFVLTSGYLELPWLLDENMEDVISPANEPEYLQKMYDTLLANADNGITIS